MTIERGRYQHYKGGYYQVIFVGRWSGNLVGGVVGEHAKMVVYASEIEGTVYVRPLEEFVCVIYHNGANIQRFTKID